MGLTIAGAANRFPDKCDNDPEGTRALNIDSSRALAQATNSRNILLLYISTDYVFPGKPGEAPYAADATPQPTNISGQTKLDGEKAVLEETQGRGLGLVLRIPVLYGDAKEPKESAINVLMDSVWKAQDADVKMDNWALRYPTNTEDVARVCVDVVSKYLDQTAKDLPRILQFSSEDRYTKYEICQLFGDIMGLATNRIVSDKPSEESKSGVQRPYDTHLSTQSLQALGIDVQTMDFTAWWYVYCFTRPRNPC